VPEPTNEPAPVGHGGIIAKNFVIRGAPGPFGTMSTDRSCGTDTGSIWYDMIIQNTGGNTVRFTRLGAFVQEKGYHKPSYNDEDMVAGEVLTWDDCFHIDSPGTYNVYLRICLNPGGCGNIAGPIQVQVQ
jgi:hypothetical protein